MFKKMAQNIAQSTGEIIGYGVLVTDEKGIIIGCSDERRIGASHPPSLAVIMENRPMTTSPGDAECLGNVLPGYTLPIQFFGRVLGSVSIAGLPEEVERYGLLVQKQAEIMLREQAFLESNLLREQAMRDLTENVASYDKRSGRGDIIMIRGRDLGFDLAKCKVAIVAEMGAWPEGSAESSFRVMSREVKAVFSNPKNVVCPHENYRVTVLFSPSSEGGIEKVYDAVLHLSGDLMDRMAEKDIETNIGVGFYAPDLEGLSTSLLSARRCLRLAGRLGAKGIIKAEDYTGEALLDSLPAAIGESFADRTLGGLKGRNDLPELKETFLAWCGSPFAGADVAGKLSLHRNSLRYRLKKIRQLTGKDPRNFKDAFELWAAFVLSDISGEFADRCEHRNAGKV